MRNIILPSGRFFKPYSAYKDNHSLACYYTRIYRERNGEKEYPLSITISDSSLSIYWHGYQRRSNNDASGKMKSLNEDYGVHQIFSIDFNDLHKDAFEKWLSGKKLIPADFIDKHTYVIQEWDQTLPPTYSDIFLYGLFTDTDAQLVFKKFILDLYFDIKYSNLFIFHPRFESMIGFLMSIPLSKGIWLKAEYLWLVNESNNLQRKEGDNHVERAKFSGDKMEESGKKWLAFLRSQEGELATAVDSGWFEGVEKEHKIAYQVSDSTYLRKEAEDSVQWLLDRYDIYRAYRFQFFKVFSLSSLFLIVIASITSIIYIIHPFKEAYKEHAVHWFFSAILIISSVVVLLLWSL
ncbi:hypothetical protein H6804_00150, partial [Candidatus Nomurabacteria bacterium]|nr:hypothetical protein [Candidatus Nomurabacteria bacterium]